MHQQAIDKRGHVIAVIGSTLAVLLAPLMSIGYHMAYGGGGDTPPFWLESLRPVLPDLNAYGGASRVYAHVGKIFAFVYVLLMPGMVQLHRSQVGRRSKLEKVSFWALMFSLAICFIGVSLDYWGISLGWTTQLIGLLVLQLASTAYGVSILRSKALGHGFAVLFLAAVPLCILSFILLRQIPSAPTVPFALGIFATSVRAMLIENEE